MQHRKRDICHANMCGTGNDSEPFLPNGRCCDPCYDLLVIPARTREEEKALGEQRRSQAERRVKARVEEIARRYGHELNKIREQEEQEHELANLEFERRRRQDDERRDREAQRRQLERETRIERDDAILAVRLGIAEDEGEQDDPNPSPHSRKRDESHGGEEGSNDC